MDTKNEATVVPAEELAEEQSGLVLPKEEEVRAEIISEFGFDETTDSEKIEKAVKREMKNRQVLSKTIGQKRSWREKAQTPIDKKVETKPNGGAEVEEPALSSDDVLALVGAQITHPEDIAELKKAAKLIGTNMAGALSDSLVMARIKDAQEKRASAKATNVAGGGPVKKKMTDAEILERAKNGEVFEKGSPEAEQLFWARRGGKKSA